MKIPKLEGFLTVSKVSKLAKKSPRYIRYLIASEVLEGSPVDERVQKSPYILTPRSVRTYLNKLAREKKGKKQ
jgi:hypothetical protein